MIKCIYIYLMANILVCAAITKYYRVGGLNNRNIFLTVVENRNLRRECFMAGSGEALLLACR